MSDSPGVIRMRAAWGELAQIAWPILDGQAAAIPGWTHVGWMRHFGAGTRMPVYMPVPYTGVIYDPIIYTHSILTGELQL